MQRCVPRTIGDIDQFRRAFDQGCIRVHLGANANTNNAADANASASHAAVAIQVAEIWRGVGDSVVQGSPTYMYYYSIKMISSMHVGWTPTCYIHHVGVSFLHD